MLMVRTSAAVGEALPIKMILLAPLCEEGFALLAAFGPRRIPRNAGEASRPGGRSGGDSSARPRGIGDGVSTFEQAWDDGKTSESWPATAPSLNQTVVVHEVLER